MNRSSYPYNKNLNTRYTFISRGKRNIEKVVDFTQTSIKNLYSLWFWRLIAGWFCFTGSTDERTLLYKRIIQTYFSEFKKDFTISGLIKVGNEYNEVEFELRKEIEYLAFFIKKIN